MIPNSIIEDIRYRCDIEDVISSYLPLKRAGTNMKGLCPFHSEKTPSFVVYKDSQSFYCFGCGAGGDVITFIMRQENLDYVSAIEFLAKRAGITLPDYDSDRIGSTVGRGRILKMNVEAAKFFRSNLFDEQKGAAARSYLAEKRGLSSSVIKHFGLGYALDGWSSLRDHLLSLGYSYEEMEAGNLCRRNDNGNCYDMFRGKVMFPIIDVSGNIVAFGGRVLDNSKPKYINSSDTPAFKKSKNLFALNYAKNSEADHLILCEGYMDVIAMHAAGFTNSVATLGTAITSEHARIIKRYVNKVVLAYDGDGAGQKATDRGIKLLNEAGVDTKILLMRDAKDPDEFIKLHGKEAFKRLLDESRSKFDYTIEQTLSKFNLSNADDKIKAAGELCREIAAVDSKVERDIYIVKTAEALSLNVESVKLDVQSIIKKNSRVAKKKQTEELIRYTSGVSDRVNPDYAKRPRAARLEESLIGILLQHPEYITSCGSEYEVRESDFVTELGRRIFSVINEKQRSEGFSIGCLSQSLTPDEVSRAIKMQTDRRELSNDESSYKTYVTSLREEASKSSARSLEDIISSKRGNS